MLTNKDQITKTINLYHCMVVHARYPRGETRVEREAQALVNHGYNVDVICLQEGKESTLEMVDGVTVYRLPVKRHKESGLIIQLFEYLAFFILASFKMITLNHQHHYNIAQVHNLPDWLVFVALLPKLTGVRVILDLHDLMPEFYSARFKKSLTSFPVRLLIWQEQISCRFADHVITVTEAWREVLIKRGLAPSKVSVVMNVADDRFFFQSSEEDQVVPKNNHLRLIYHGNLTYRYGVDLAIQAINKVKEQIPSIHLHIHGWGDAAQALFTMTDDLGLKDFVSFSTKGLPTAELPALIKQADICLVPYRQDVFTDGILPTKLMEYAALGMPAIAARTTAIQAYFNDANVEFFEPGNVDDLVRCIIMLYKDPDYLMKLAKASQNFTQIYNWKKVSKTYVSLVDQLRLGKLN